MKRFNGIARRHQGGPRGPVTRVPGAWPRPRPAPTNGPGPAAGSGPRTMNKVPARASCPFSPARDHDSDVIMILM